VTATVPSSVVSAGFADRGSLDEPLPLLHPLHPLLDFFQAISDDHAVLAPFAEAKDAPVAQENLKLLAGVEEQPRLEADVGPPFEL
jgi:hypothetical protein